MGNALTRILAITTICLAAFGAGAQADSGPGKIDMAEQDLTPGGKARVTAVIDGDSLRLADGRALRLVGIQAPERLPGQRGAATLALAEAARAHLQALALGATLQLYYGGAPLDRYGRVLAQAETEDGVWLQGAMLEAGLAHVYSFPDNRALIDAMLTREGAARAQRRGIWRHPSYQVLDAAGLDGAGARLQGRFAIIEGTVLAAEVARGTLYVNFGRDWQRDFTLILRPGAKRRFRGVDWVQIPGRLVGRVVEVRGWVEDKGGPMIELTHPEQLQFPNVHETEGMSDVETPAHDRPPW
ncbi:MAG: thermonuclease family protein [Pseudomonadota bacterium]